MNKNKIFLATSFSMLISAVSHADQLHLNNGSQLIGTIISKKADSLEFKTDYAGTILVNLSHIREIKSDKPLKLLLNDQSIIQSNHLQLDNNTITIQESNDKHPLSSLNYINPKPWQTGLSYKKTGAANIAIKYKDGNSESEDYNLDAKLDLRGLKDRYALFGEYEKSESENIKTAENWLVSAKYDYFFHKQTFLGGSLLFEHDKFSNIDLKQVYGLHIGHQYYESDEINLSVNAGLAKTSEKNLDNIEDDYSSATWEVNYDQYFFEKTFQLYHKQIGIQSLEDSENYHIKTWTGVKFPLQKNITLSTEAQISYDNSMTNDQDKTDSSYLLKLGYTY